MATFLFSVHTITKAKQYSGWIFWSFDLVRPGVAPPLVKSNFTFVVWFAVDDRLMFLWLRYNRLKLSQLLNDSAGLTFVL